MVANIFGVGVHAPAVLTLYMLFPDWSLMYLANPAHLSGFLMVPVLLLLAVGGPALGFLAVDRALRQTERWRRQAVWIAPGVVAAIILLFGSGRILTVAYYDAFHGSVGGLSLFQSALFLPLMLTVGAVTSAYVYAVMHLKRHVELCRGLPTGR
jgi:hypothetical protein